MSEHIDQQENNMSDRDNSIVELELSDEIDWYGMTNYQIVKKAKSLGGRKPFPDYNTNNIIQTCVRDKNRDGLLHIIKTLPPEMFSWQGVGSGKNIQQVNREKRNRDKDSQEAHHKDLKELGVQSARVTKQDVIGLITALCTEDLVPHKIRRRLADRKTNPGKWLDAINGEGNDVREKNLKLALIANKDTALMQALITRGIKLDTTTSVGSFMNNMHNFKIILSEIDVLKLRMDYSDSINPNYHWKDHAWSLYVEQGITNDSEIARIINKNSKTVSNYLNGKRKALRAEESGVLLSVV